MSFEGVKIKFVETPPFLISFDSQVRFINMWINDMQRNDIIILSNKPHRQENIDGTLTNGFLIEYRETLDVLIPMEEESDFQQ